MECKNCKSNLRTAYSYCPDCGAKVIRNRLTVKNLCEDFTEKFLNIDNTFIKTFLHLFSNPESVIEGFINGTRKKYLNPISYLTVALLLSGLAFLILRKYYGVQLMGELGNKGVFYEKMEIIYDFQSLLAYTSLPIYAVLTWIFYLDKGKFNFTEHFVINTYIVAQYSILQFLIIIPLYGVIRWDFQIFSSWFMFIVIMYQFYVLRRLHGTKILNTILRAIGYTGAMTITVGIVYGAIMLLLLLITGDFNIEDFVPK